MSFVVSDITIQIVRTLCDVHQGMIAVTVILTGKSNMSNDNDVLKQGYIKLKRKNIGVSDDMI